MIGRLLLLLALMPLLLPSPASATLVDGFYGFNSYLTSGEIRAAALQPWDGKVIIGGLFTVNSGGYEQKNLARINPDGSLDSDFNASADDAVDTIVLQPDPSDPGNSAKGFILLGGSFATVTTSYDDGSTIQRIPWQRNGLARLNLDGTMDSFGRSTGTGTVIKAIALFPGKNSIIVGGAFTEMDSQPCNNIARLAQETGALLGSYLGGVTGGEVNALLLQGRSIVAGGSFTSPRQYAARFLEGGALDSSFVAAPAGAVRSLALQVDTKIVMGGDFTGFNNPPGTQRNHLARLSKEGVPDDFDPAPNAPVSSIALQPDGKILIGGEFTEIARPDPQGSGAPAPRNYLARIDIDGSLDPPVSGSPDDEVTSLAVQPDGKFLVAGKFASCGLPVRKMLARFYREGTLDDDVPALGKQILAVNQSGSEGPLTMALHPDGYLTLGGSFDQIGDTPRYGVARIRPDWTLASDDEFKQTWALTYEGTDPSIKATTLQPDGKVIIGGYFYDLSDPEHPIWPAVRVSADGVMDGSFNDNMDALRPAFSAADLFLVVPTGTKLPNGQPDFSIYLGGTATGFYLVKLNSNGVRDTGFDTGSIPQSYGEISAIAMQEDHKLVVGTRSGVVLRLKPTGELDDTFPVLHMPDEYWYPPRITSIAIQPDGQILLSGFFFYPITRDGRTWKQSLVRLNNGRSGFADGTVDEAFNVEPSNTPGIPDGPVLSIGLQSDGNIVIGGVFTRITDVSGTRVSRDGVARITPAGALDLTFRVGTFQSNGGIGKVNFGKIQQDGKLIVAGPFAAIDEDYSYQQLIRISKGWATEELTVSDTDGTVIWLRGGAGPEVTNVTFERSDDNGASWSFLGEGGRVAGGWLLGTTELGEPGQTHLIRARGYTTSENGGMGGIVESVRIYYPTTTVSKQLLKVVALPAKRMYGAANPVFQVQYLDGDTNDPVVPDSVTGAPAVGTSANETSGIGWYSIDIAKGSLSSTKYDFEMVPGQLEITRRPASVTPSAAGKLYGGSDPVLSGTLAGFLPSDNIAASYGRGAEEKAGSCTISATLAPAAALNNYDITYNTATFTIAKRPASVTPNAAGKYYGDDDPPLGGTMTGFLPADNVTATYLRFIGDIAGSYRIGTILQPSAVLDNYDITYNFATFTVARRPASVAPAAAGKSYGESDPPLTGTLTGFLPDDEIGASYTRSAGESASATPYPISATLWPAARLANYSVTYNTAGFTIGKKEVTVEAVDALKVYGRSDPQLQCNKEDFVPGDLGVGRISCYSLRAGGEGAGSYPITPGLVDNGTGLLANYEVRYRTATFTIAKAPLTITAQNKSRPCGSPNPELTVKFAGLAGSDTPASLGGLPAVSTGAAIDSPVGSYPIVVGLGSIASTNYDYSFVNGLLTVTGAIAQSITFNPMRPKTYGDADFDPGASASSGLQVSYRSSDDGISRVVGGKLRVLAPGSALITASQGGDEEYLAADDVPQTLTVNPPPWNGLGFDGIDDLLLVPDGAQLNFGGKPGLTIETWLRLDGPQPDGTGILAKGTAGTGYQLLLYGNRIAAQLGDGTTRFGADQGLIGSSSLDDGQWHHVAFALDRVGGTASLYLDGRLEAQVVAPALNPDNIEPLRVGGDASGSRFFKGALDELRLWESARGQEEIRDALAQIIDPLNEPHLMAYFHFDEGDAALENAAFGSAPERTANGANGTLQGFALSGPASNWVRSGAFLPLLETAAVVGTGDGSATSGGLVYPNYYPANDAGICWSTSANPTLADSCVHAGSGAGPFSAAMGGLTPGASYHVRAFARNAMGTAYGNDLYYQPGRLAQSIQFGLSDKSYGDPSSPLQGVASSGLAVSYASSNPKVAVVADGELQIIGAGSTVITASQPGDETYAPAPEVALQFNVAKAPLTVKADDKARAFLTPNPSFSYSLSGFVNGENASQVSGLPILSSAATLESPVADYPIVVAAGSLAAKNYRFVPVNGVLSVLKSCQEIVFPAIGERTYGDPPFRITAATCSGLGILFASSDPQVARVDGNTLTVIGAGSVVITASQTGNGGLEQAPEVSQSVVVHKSGQQLSFAPLPRKLLGDSPFTLNASASSGLPVGFASSDPSVAALSGNVVTIVGAGTTVISALQQGNGNYNAALPVSQPLVVAVEGDAPTLLLSTVSSGAVTSDPVLNISGSASDPSGIAGVTVNGSAVAGSAGQFSSAVSLVSGENSVSVTARDGAGNQTTRTVNVMLNPDAPAVTVALPDNSVTDQSFFTASGTVSSGSSLAMSVNGGAPQSLAVTDGSFNGSGYLEQGVNTIEFVAALDGCSCRVKRTVSFAPDKPAAAITVPAEDIKTEQRRLVIRGAAAADATVVLVVDGTSVTPALQGGRFEQQISLQHPGQTSVLATVTDNSGNSSTVQRNIVKLQSPLGDLNGDGVVDLRDAVLALRFALGLEQVTPEVLVHADVAPLVHGIPQPDGKIDVGDVVVILRKVVGLVDF